MQGYKTITFNALAILVALVQHFGGPLPEVDPGVLAAMVAVVNVGLRMVTKTPVFSKEGQ